MAGSIWKHLSGDLAVATENEFVRRLRPLLRVLWPALSETPHRQHWDSFGIDLVEWTDRGSFPIVVQCKGWHVQEIGREQARLVNDSVSSFLESGAVCEHFVVVHNRDGRFGDFNEAATRSLERLIAAGVAQRTSLLDRQKFLLLVKREIDRRVIDALRLASRQRVHRFPDLFLGGDEYVEKVPFSRSTIRIRRNEPSSVLPQHATVTESVPVALLRPKGLSWTILEGSFGSGKTSAVLQAAQSADRIVVVIPCSDLPSVGNISFNDVLAQAIRETDLWVAHPVEERPQIDALAADSAIRLLSDKTAADEYLMVFDGLDEHRAFYQLGGLQRLLNQLIDVECPVVLTTRSEHFKRFFDNYSAAFSELSWKFKADVPIPLITLERWTPKQTLELIQRVGKQQGGSPAERLRELAGLVTSGAAEQLYGTLIYNALMLRFIVDDVIEDGVSYSARAPLIARWVRRKLWRDVRKHPFVAEGDLGETVDHLVRATELIAARMTETTKDGIRLTESLPLDAVRQIVASETRFDVADVLTNSFLMPIRSPSGARIVFSFRILQEYFLAAHYRRVAQQDEGWPDEVGALYMELAVEASEAGANPGG